MFVRVDALPNRLFRYTGINWMKIDKQITDTYLNEEYVDHLTDQVVHGVTDIDDLTQLEQEEVENAIKKRRASNAT